MFHRSLRRLAVNAVAILAGTASVLVAPAATSVARAASADVWTVTGPSGTITSQSDGSTSPPSFSYYYCAGYVTNADNQKVCESSGVSQQTWTFEATASQSGSITVSYDWTGNHAWCMAEAGLSAFVASSSTILVPFNTPTACDQQGTASGNVFGDFRFSGTYTFENLTEGESYGFTLSGENADASSFLSGTFAITTGLPTNLTAIAGPSQVQLSWSEPNTLYAPTSYEIFEGGAPGQEALTPTATVSAPATSATISGLAYNKAYYFTVEANGPGGPSASSNEVSATTTGQQAALVLTSTTGTFGTPLVLSTSGGSGTGGVTYAVQDGTAAGCAVTDGALSANTPGTCIVTATNPGDASYAPISSAPTTVTLTAVVPSNVDWTSAKPLTAPGSTTQAIDYPGEDLWYDFPVVPGEQVTVSLTNVPADDNVALFSDIAQTYQSETSSTPNLAALGAEAPGNAASPSAFSPSAFSPSAFSPSAFSPSAFSGYLTGTATTSPSAFSGALSSPSAFSSIYSAAQIDSLLAVSTAPGAVDKSVTADTWNDTGTFYVRVSGENGANSALPYTLSVTTSGGPCAGVTLNTYAGTPTLSAPAGSSYQTVIVDNSALMPAAGASYSGSDALAPALGQLVSATGGTVVDVAKSQQVEALVKQAQTDPGCPYAENLVAGAIQHIINSYRTAASNVKYVVIVGDDNVIPFFRYPDNAGLAPESDYEPPLLSTSAADAALANNYYLSDDQYGAASVLSIHGATVPLETAAVGRLVETPSDILGAIHQYLSDKGVLPTPTSSLATGYSFMQPPATEVAKAFAAGIPNGTNDTLITNDGIPASTTGAPPNASWTATALANALFGSHHSLVFLGAHFSANNLLAADDTTTMTTNQFQSGIGSSLDNSLVLSAGCHAGYNIDGQDAVPGVTDPLAWPQAVTEAGATLIAGTGYQYGDTNYVAYSDQVYVDLAKQLDVQPGASPGPVAIGAALLAAKQQYLAGVDQLNGIEEKALSQITLYGLPMLGLQEPSQTVAPGQSQSAVSASPVTSQPGKFFGLQEANFAVSPSLTPKSLSENNETYTYDSGPQGVTADPGAPVLPLQTDNVAVTGETLRGVGLWSGTYADTSGTNPLTGDPVTDTSNSTSPSPFASAVFFPQTMWNPNYFRTLVSGGATDLAVTPVQYRSDPNGATTATMRVYSSLDLHLFYDDNTTNYGADTPALAAPPSISQVSSTTSGDEVTVTASVTGDPGAGMQQVWVTYTGAAPGDPLAGSWQSVDLTQSATNSTRWSGTFTDPGSTDPAHDARFVVQAVNGVGEVAMDNNDGYLFTPTLTPGAPLNTRLASTKLRLSGATSGTFGASATVSATLTSTSTTAEVSGKPVVFTLAGSSVSATTDSTGTATASLPIIEAPGSYTLTASYVGDAQQLPAAASTGFVVTRAKTLLVLSAPTQVTDGAQSGITATLTTSSGTPLSQKTVYFDLADPAGRVVASVAQATNRAGVAEAGALNIPPGDVGPGYVITASFGSSAVPLVGGETYDASDPDYAAGTSTPASVRVIDPTTTMLSVSPEPLVFGHTANLVATVSPSSSTTKWGTSAPSGSVTFSDGGQIIGTAPLVLAADGRDRASLAVDGLQPGSQSFLASYRGTTSYLASSAPASATVTVTETLSGTHLGRVVVGAGDAVMLTGHVFGGVTVRPGGALAVEGGSITGRLASMGATAISLCGAQIRGGVAIFGSTGYVLIGGGPGVSCQPTTIMGAVLINNNTGGLGIAGNTSHGAMFVGNNSGDAPFELNGVAVGPEISDNAIAGVLACSANTPAPVDAGVQNKVTMGLGQCALGSGLVIVKAPAEVHGPQHDEARPRPHPAPRPRPRPEHRPVVHGRH